MPTFTNIVEGAKVTLPLGPIPAEYTLKGDATGPIIDYNHDCLFTVEQDLGVLNSYVISKITRSTGAVAAQINMTLLDQSGSHAETVTGMCVDSGGFLYVCTWTEAASDPFPNRLYKFDNSLSFVSSVQHMSIVGKADGLDSFGGQYLIPVDTLAGHFIFSFAEEEGIIVWNRDTMTEVDDIFPANIVGGGNLAFADKNGDIWIVCSTATANVALVKEHYNADSSHVETQYDISSIVSGQTGLNYQAWYDSIDHAVVFGGQYQGSILTPTIYGHSFWKLDLATITVTATLDIPNGGSPFFYYPYFLGVERSRSPQAFGPSGTGYQAVTIRWQDATFIQHIKIGLVDHNLNWTDLTNLAFGIDSITGGVLSGGWLADGTATDPGDLVFASDTNTIWTWQPYSFYWPSLAFDEFTYSLERFDLISTAPILSVEPTDLVFAAVKGGSNPPYQPIIASNIGSGGDKAVTITTNHPWLSVSPASGNTQLPIHVLVDITGLNVGSYPGTVTVTSAGVTGSPKTVNVTLVVSEPNLAPDAYFNLQKLAVRLRQEPWTPLAGKDR